MLNPFGPIQTYASVFSRNIKHMMYHFTRKAPFAQYPHIVNILTVHKYYHTYMSKLFSLLIQNNITHR